MKKKVKIVLLSAAILIGIVISITDVFFSFDRNLISWYLKDIDIIGDEIVVVTVEEESFVEEKLWPWSSGWSKYLVSFILDLKPRNLVLGSRFVKEVKDLNSYGKILRDPRLVMPFSSKESVRENDESPTDFIQQRRGYFHYYNRNNNLSEIGFSNSGESAYSKKMFNKQGFYFLPQDENVTVISANSIALSGFLKSEGYKAQDEIDFIKDKIVLLESNGGDLNKEISFLSAQLHGNVFLVLAREFNVYIAVFMFAVIYILLRSIKLRKAILIFLLLLGGSFIFQRIYFSVMRIYIELAPVVIFAFLGLIVSVLEQEYDMRIHRKDRKETQLARMLKDKEILPHSIVTSNGAVVNVTRYKMDKVGGDFYQFLEFAKGELGIVLGWVPGSGVERVRYIMEIVHSWRDFASVYKEPGKVIQVLNNSLFRYAEEGKYTTFIYLLYDAKKGFLKYVNAGHDPLIFVDKKENIKIINAQEPTPLGIARDVPFYEGEINLTEIGDAMVIGYSGGISRLIADSGGLKSEFLQRFNSYLKYESGKLSDEVFSDFLKYYSKKPEEEWSLLTLKITEPVNPISMSI
ncbi:MAG: PP2C family protein-serine/threonine phosphatase [Candidatus Saelkia tenebricola]|nr:PP2C family protein-serine/threonine phosphatase [Candidatus Saelkia tenebricola]